MNQHLCSRGKNILYGYSFGVIIGVLVGNDDDDEEDDDDDDDDEEDDDDFTTVLVAKLFLLMS